MLTSCLKPCLKAMFPHVSRVGLASQVPVCQGGNARPLHQRVATAGTALLGCGFELWERQSLGETQNLGDWTWGFMMVKICENVYFGICLGDSFLGGMMLKSIWNDVWKAKLKTNLKNGDISNSLSWRKKTNKQIFEMNTKPTWCCRCRCKEHLLLWSQQSVSGAPEGAEGIHLGGCLSFAISMESSRGGINFEMKSIEQKQAEWPKRVYDSVSASKGHLRPTFRHITCWELDTSGYIMLANSWRIQVTC